MDVETRTEYRNPGWWTSEHDSAWDRVREAFRRDWEQTKHDFGGDAPDLKQDVDDTVALAAGREPTPPMGQANVDVDEEEEFDTFAHYEPAMRFGYGARRQYGSQFSDWNTDLESRLRTDWEATYTGSEYGWDRYRNWVRRGWDYRG